MANDITLSKSDQPIKNGTTIVSTTPTGEHSLLNTYAQNTPIISEIQSKYTDKFDDPSYYYSSYN
jgi:hypothetical protein